MADAETFTVADFAGPCPHVEALTQLHAEWLNALAVQRNAQELRDVLAGHLADALDRAERAEAAIAEVLATCDLFERMFGQVTSVPTSNLRAILAVLDSSETPPAAPGFGTASPAAAELAARATSGGRMSANLSVRLEDEPPAAAPVPEERTDEKLPESCHSPEHCRPGHCEDPRWCISSDFDDAPVDGETT